MIFLFPHQANKRIAQYVQQQLGLPDEKVMVNIEKYGNTTAASIPIALSEAIEEGRMKRGDLVCLSAFGSGFTWGSVFIRILSLQKIKYIRTLSFLMAEFFIF